VVFRTPNSDKIRSVSDWRRRVSGTLYSTENGMTDVADACLKLTIRTICRNICRQVGFRNSADAAPGNFSAAESMLEVKAGWRVNCGRVLSCRFRPKAEKLSGFFITTEDNLSMVYSQEAGRAPPASEWPSICFGPERTSIEFVGKAREAKATQPRKA